MRLLILTQKVDQNDDVLGFFHRWIAEFAKHCDQVTVIALGVGEYHLPANVCVFSLGKELRERSDLKNLDPRSVLEEQLRKVRYILNFYRIIWRERKNYDTVFVHMNPVYVILGGSLWRVWGKKVGLWYTHKHVDMKLRVAEKFADAILTASSESFRLPSNKVEIVGHGIDTEIFKPIKKAESEVFRIVTAGRISPVKDYETLVKAIEVLLQEGVFVQADIIGGPVTALDKNYFEQLCNLVREKKLEKAVRFIGPTPNKDLPGCLQRADIFVNMSRTGSLDKAVLEAMACGVPVITSNEAFNKVLGTDATTLVFRAGDTKAFADRIRDTKALSLDGRIALGLRLRAIVEKDHNIKILIPRILDVLL